MHNRNFLKSEQHRLNHPAVSSYMVHIRIPLQLSEFSCHPRWRSVLQILRMSWMLPQQQLSSFSTFCSFSFSFPPEMYIFHPYVLSEHITISESFQNFFWNKKRAHETTKCSVALLHHFNTLYTESQEKKQLPRELPLLFIYEGLLTERIVL